MTALQDRLFAGRARRAAQEQEELARQLRTSAEIPAQRASDPSTPTLSVVAPAEVDETT
jgi:hypothetical protein